MNATFKNVLFWSIISAAFIGPGTVTTASKAGASFGLSLLWALVFSTLATMVLQEAAARITIASGKNLGEIIAQKYSGAGGLRLKWLLFLAVAFGCAAYQAGNMLGAVSGVALVWEVDARIITAVLGILCAGLLWIGNLTIIARVLGLVVALMGIAFIVVAVQADVSSVEVLQNAVVPSFPEGSSLLVIGLIGTTIVPYNLFLASGISPGQQIKDMRQGIIGAVLIGGMISMAIMVVGTQVQGVFSFEALAVALSTKLGAWGAVFFGIGLFAAGMSSSITSPLAAAVTAKSLFGDQANWAASSGRFKGVWAVILGIGLLFGVSGIKPIPVIILAQAINGALLPIVAVFLILMVNDKSILSKKHLNTSLLNVVSLLIVGITGFLGMNNMLKAIANAVPAVSNWQMEGALAVAFAVTIGLGIKIFKT